MDNNKEKKNFLPFVLTMVSAAASVTTTQR